ncbi:Uncharacterised protein [Mycobacteroides abscessus subsp. abscessus]|nr:Uncharacterised protein [Mycobacteroides abscessus subsp. abscessus]SLD08390.1 Uncharacterised protein [Mycobacteroides abscessus subsp. massiliense]
MGGGPEDEALAEPANDKSGQYRCVIVCVRVDMAQHQQAEGRSHATGNEHCATVQPRQYETVAERRGEHDSSGEGEKSHPCPQRRQM